MTSNTPEEISPEFPFEKQTAEVIGSKMEYIDVGNSNGLATVFLHGNPMSSYLWRNIIPHVSSKSRCVAPDLIGFGDSDKIPGLEYRVVDHQRYIDAFLDVVLPTEKLILVIHDWGSALGFDWARRHEDRVAGLAFMEFIPPTDSWDLLPEVVAENFKAFRDPLQGRELGFWEIEHLYVDCPL
ncbi:alpha/beta-hydrolase [Thozetella sp. PMI_491]|nr:alpha/beta-hydrolase [Thozetella sp. PMI_491]